MTHTLSLESWSDYINRNHIEVKASSTLRQNASVHQTKITLNVHLTINILQKSYVLAKLWRIEKFTIISRDVDTPLSAIIFFFIIKQQLIKDTRDVNVPK